MSKYPRTFHLPYSPGATRDDRIQHDVSSLIGVPIVITEKLDGSNVCLRQDGVFARSHSGAPNHPSFDALKAIHASIPFPLFYYDVFGEWCYAVHSIEYSSLPSYFMSFGIRHQSLKDSSGKEYEAYWLPWDETVTTVESYGLITTPVLYEGQVSSEKELETLVKSLASQPSACGGDREGVVVRIANAFAESDFSKSVLKFVRKDHVQTDTHWKHKEIVKNKLRK